MTSASELGLEKSENWSLILAGASAVAPVAAMTAAVENAADAAASARTRRVLKEKFIVFPLSR